MSYGINSQYNPYTVTSINDVATQTDAEMSALGMGDFLTLMVAQLTNQTIDNQVDDAQFLSQMAQFSSLQLMQELRTTMENSMSVSYLGKYAMASRTETVYVTDAEGNMVADYRTFNEVGEVTAVDMRNNKLMMQIGNYWFEAKDLLRVSNKPITDETAPENATGTEGTDGVDGTDAVEDTGEVSGEGTGDAAAGDGAE